MSHEVPPIISQETESSEEEKKKLVNKKTRNIIAGVAMGAAAVAGGQARNAEGAPTAESVSEEDNTPHYIHTLTREQEGKMRAEKRAENAIDRQQKSDAQWERLRDLAKQMDVYEANIVNGEIVEKLSSKKVAGVFIEINGKQVPQELLNADEIQQLETAQKYEQTMNTMNSPDYEVSQPIEHSADNPTSIDLDEEANGYNTDSEKSSTPQENLENKKESKSKDIESMTIDGSIY